MKRNSLVALILATGAGALSAQTQFVPLGYLDGFGPTSEAIAMDVTGTKLVGYSTTSLTSNVAAEWTTSSPASWLVDGRIAPVTGYQHWLSNQCLGISADGGVVVGQLSSGGSEESFYWTAAGEIQLIPLPVDPLRRASVAWGVSADGQVVVGHTDIRLNEFSDAVERRAFVWDRSQALASYLPPLTGSSVPNRTALSASGDGSRIVGQAQASLTAQAAVRWDNGAAPQILHQAGDTVVSLSANGISFDGNVVVGQAIDTVAGKNVAFKWTPAGGIMALPSPTTGVYAYSYTTAIRASGDGRVIVGYGENVVGSEEAIFWVDDQPYRVSDIALAAGVLPPSWEPFRAYAVDYSGNSIAGYGRASSGKVEAYVLVIDATPDPPAPVLPAVASAYQGGALHLSYTGIPGLNYRVLGGTSPMAMQAIEDWQAGTGIQRSFVADAGVTGGAAAYFLQVEVEQP